MCAAYNAHTFDLQDRLPGAVFRNPHCALCNHVPADDLSCQRSVAVRMSGGGAFSSQAFSILLDVGDRSGSDRVGTVRVCRGARLWDPFFRKCRDVACDPGFRLAGDACEPDPVDVDTIVFPDRSGGIVFPDERRSGAANASSTPTPSFAACPKYYLSADEFTRLPNGSVFVETYGRRFARGEFAVRDGELAVCAITRDLAKFDSALSYVSTVCLVASMLCLFFHLVVFGLVADIRNLSGRNLAALCVCLLVGYACFLLSPLQQPGRAGCAAIAVVMYAAFIASFGWMNVMAFDVFYTLRQASIQLRVTEGRQTRRFLLYTLYVVALTGALLAAVLVADNSAATDAAFRPGFGASRACWFSRRRALVIFFAAPLAAVMAANVALFVASTRLVRRTMASTAHMTCAPSRINLRLYCRLATITGLSWVVGLAAGWLDFPPLWYAFVVLNTLQGVFIFLSFTMAERVRNRVLRRASQYSRWMPRSGASGSAGVDNTGSTDLPLTRSRP